MVFFALEIIRRVQETKVEFQRFVRQQGQHQGGNDFMRHGRLSAAQRYQRGVDVQSNDFRKNRSPVGRQRVHDYRGICDVVYGRYHSAVGQNDFDESIVIRIRYWNGSFQCKYYTELTFLYV